MLCRSSVLFNRLINFLCIYFETIAFFSHRGFSVQELAKLLIILGQVIISKGLLLSQISDKNSEVYRSE